MGRESSARNRNFHNKCGFLISFSESPFSSERKINFSYKEFYENVNNFIKTFSACSCLYDFYDKFDEEKLKRYKMDLKRFVEIKKTTQLANGEKVDFSKYKDQLRKLLDKYVFYVELKYKINETLWHRI